jgi:hypothetical protein
MMSQRKFAQEMVVLGVSGELGYQFDATIDDQIVTPENFGEFSDDEIARLVFHGIALKDKNPGIVGKLRRKLGVVRA